VTWEAYELFRVGEQGKHDVEVIPISLSTQGVFGGFKTDMVQILGLRAMPSQHSFLSVSNQMLERRLSSTFLT
jgi:hypothetical protein